MAYIYITRVLLKAQGCLSAQCCREFSSGSTLLGFPRNYVADVLVKQASKLRWGRKTSGGGETPGTSGSGRVADELNTVQHSPKQDFTGLPWEERSLLGPWRDGKP